MCKKYLLWFLCLIIHLSINGQKGLQFISDNATRGYVLMESQGDAILIDNCGREVHRWDDVSSTYHPKLLSNGNLVYIDVISGGIVERDWDGQIINQVFINDPNKNLIYEMIVLPNGNYLSLAREGWSIQQFNAIGYDFGVIGNPTQVDMVVELDRQTGNIVWEWKISDHVIQERDPNQANYGSLKDNPQLLNMDAISIFDWTFQESFMINGFDYNPSLDQIALSVRKLSEVVIIDHSTTTEEAKGSTGGNQGKGGDVLFRWGNPQNYDRGDEDDRELYLQHNPNWIEHGPHTGKMIVYDNGLGRPVPTFDDRYSAAKIIDTGVSLTGGYTLSNDQPFLPKEPVVEYSRPETNTVFYSSYTSGAKVLPNGNIFITIGDIEEAMEIDQQGNVLWKYGVPDLFSFLFRTEKYAEDYSAFIGKDLVPGNVVEFPPSSVSCILSTENNEWKNEVSIINVNRQLRIDTDLNHVYQSRLYNAAGQLILSKNEQGPAILNVGRVPAGIYFISLQDQSGRMFNKKVLIK